MFLKQLRCNSVVATCRLNSSAVSDLCMKLVKKSIFPRIRRRPTMHRGHWPHTTPILLYIRGSRDHCGHVVVNGGDERLFICRRISLAPNDLHHDNDTCVTMATNHLPWSHQYPRVLPFDHRKRTLYTVTQNTLSMH